MKYADLVQTLAQLERRFRQFASKENLKRWLLLPNLSYPYNYGHKKNPHV